MATVLTGQFTGTGTSDSFALHGKANILIEDGAGTVHIEKSFDDGNNYYVTSKNSDGDAASYAASVGNVAFHGIVEEIGQNILYRLNCTAYTSGTIKYTVYK